MIGKKGYIFTNKEHPQKGIMSTVLGIISAVSVIMILYLSFQNNGAAEVRDGVAMLLALFFSIAGLVLGIASRMEPDKYYLFSYAGIVVNGLVLLGIGFILFAGAYGI